MKRKLYAQIEAHLPKREFSILTGARQVGKSTLLKQLHKAMEERHSPSVFINLERQDIRKMLDDDPLNLLRFLPNTAQRTTVFVDEIQYLSDPTNFLKLIYDEHADRIKIVATGSSAFYMDEKFTDSLAGRKKLFFMPTCSFEEYLQLREQEDLVSEYQRILENKESKSLKLRELELAYKDFLRFGGYPAVILEENHREKIDRLHDLRDSFLKRDIAESDVQNENAFYGLFQILAAQSGNLLNVNELANTLHVQSATVQRYLLVLQKCFHISLIRPFFSNVRKELIKMPKVYLMDGGMRNCILNNFQPFDLTLDQGAQWENAVFRSLIERYSPEDIKFWRTADGHEVDFVLPNADTPFALEVITNKSSAKLQKYRSFTEQYPSINLRFATIKPFSEDTLRIMNT